MQSLFQITSLTKNLSNTCTLKVLLGFASCFYLTVNEISNTMVLYLKANRNKEKIKGISGYIYIYILYSGYMYIYCIKF